MNERVQRPGFAFRYRPLPLAAALFCSGVVPIAASAQEEVAEAEADADAEMETVFVTATRRAEGVQDVPLNISAVNNEMIEEQNLQNLADLIHQVPGLHLVDQGGRDSNLIIVRGLNGNSLGASEGVGNESGGVVAQYIGDIPLYLDLRLLDLERVEALLGPQGTLYGAGTLGGAIRYIPVRPQFDATTLAVKGGAFGMSHSDDLGTETEVIGNLPLSSKLALRGSVGYFDEPGFIDYDYVVREAGVSDPEPDFGDPQALAANLKKHADANTLETLSGRMSLRYAPIDAVDAVLSYHYQDQKAGARTINQKASFDTGSYVSANRFLEPNDRENQLLSLEVEADLGFATLSSASGYSKYEEDGQRDQTDLLLGFEYGYEEFPSFAAYTHELAEEERFTQELRLVSNGDGPFNWIVGAFYNEADSDSSSAEYAPGIPEFFGVDRPDNLEYFEVNSQHFEESALFGELGYELTDRWAVTVGGRFFQYDVSASDGFALPLIDGSAPDEILLDSEVADVSDDDAIFKFNTSYDFTDDVLGYFTLSEGYRNGGVNPVPSCSTPLDPGQNVCALPDERLFVPDKTLNHELGLRSMWWGGRLKLNASVYYIKWDSPQISGTTVNGSIPITVNADSAASKGVELNGVLRINGPWSVSAGYAYAKAELTADAPGIVSGANAFDGDRLPGSPEHQGNVTLMFEQPLSNGMLLKANYGVFAQSDVYTRAGLRNGGEALGGYAVHNASVSVARESWKVKVYASNLFDKYAETGVRSTPNSIYAVGSGDTDNGDGFKLRSYYKSVLDPMRVGVNLTYYFGGV